MLNRYYIIALYVCIRGLQRFDFTRTEPHRPLFDPVWCDKNRKFSGSVRIGVTKTKIIPVRFESV